MAESTPASLVPCNLKAWAVGLVGLVGGNLALLFAPGIGDYRARLMLYYGVHGVQRCPAVVRCLCSLYSLFHA